MDLSCCLVLPSGNVPPRRCDPCAASPRANERMKGPFLLFSSPPLPPPRRRARSPLLLLLLLAPLDPRRGRSAERRGGEGRGGERGAAVPPLRAHSLAPSLPLSRRLSFLCGSVRAAPARSPARSLARPMVDGRAAMVLEEDGHDRGRRDRRIFHHLKRVTPLSDRRWWVKSDRS